MGMVIVDSLSAKQRGSDSLLSSDHTSTFNMIVPIAYPRTQGVHVSAAAWGHDGLKNSVLELIRAGKVTAVEISLKNVRARSCSLSL